MNSTFQRAFDSERNELLINNWQKFNLLVFAEYGSNLIMLKPNFKNILLQIFALNKTNLELALVYTMTIVCI